MQTLYTFMHSFVCFLIVCDWIICDWIVCDWIVFLIVCD